MITLQGIHKLRWLLAFCIALGVALLWQPLPARAETITVTNTLDDGAGSLRAAIAAAQPGDTVVFSDTLAGEVIFLESPLNITQNLTLDGSDLSARLIISTYGNMQLFIIADTATVTMTQLRLSGGSALVSAACEGGGGAICNAGALTLQGMYFANNYATSNGGAVYSSAGSHLWVYDSEFDPNIAGTDGGALYIGLGAVAQVTNCRFQNNFAGQRGGGIHNLGTMQVLSSTIAGNTAGVSGGGIRNEGTLTVTASTLSGNTAAYGGGIANLKTLRLNNSTFSGNTATHATYGGSAMDLWGANDTEINHCTIVSNTANLASDQSGILLEAGTLILRNSIVAHNNDTHNFHRSGGTFTSQGYNLANAWNGLTTQATDLTGAPLLAALADNGGGTFTHALLPGSPALDAANPTVSLPTDHRGVARPQDFDHDGNAVSDIGAFEALPPEIFLTKSADPAVDVPYHGVVTYTLVLHNTSADTDPTVFLTDTLPAQVTFARWVGDYHGALVSNDQIVWTGSLSAQTALTFTFQVTHTGNYGETIVNTADFSGLLDAGQATASFVVACGPALTVTNIADDGPGSLRQAVSGICPAGVVTFAPALAGETITLSSTILIDKSMTLDGSGLSARVRLSGDDATRMFVIEDTAAVTMTQLILTQGYANYHPECIYYGGAICNTGALTLQDMRFTENQAQNGGAVYSYANTRLWVNASEFYSNTATSDGGALYVYYDNTSAQVLGSVFMTNTAYNGGAIVNQGAVLTITDSLVSGNRSTQSGGGLYLYDGTTTLAGNTIVHNQGMSGGGVYNFAGAVVITGTHILTNTGSTGGALYNSQGHLSITQTLIAGNIAADSGGGLFLYRGMAAISDSTLRANRTSPSSGRWGGAILNTEWSVLVITRSAFTGNQARENGGGIYNTSAPLTVQASDFISNTAQEGGALYSGNGTLNVTASAFYSNTATINGGGLRIGGGNAAIATSIVASNTAASGAGLYSEYSIVSLTNSTLSGNTANTGGALYSGNGTLNVTASAFYSNTATTNGGGLRIGGGEAAIATSIVASNTAANGAGIYNEDAYVNLTNSTLSGNTATLSGGGLVNSPGNLTLHHVTLAANSAITGGGLINMGGVLDAYNNILAHNVGGDCDNTTTPGFIAANVHNLIADGSCNENAVGLITGDPRLTPLDAAGVHALQPDSPAIDAGDAATCLATDQRGVTRPQGAACDIGAYEATPHIRINKTVTPSVIVPGQAITFTLTLSNDGSIPAIGIVVTDTLPSLLENVSFASTLIITDTGHTPSYVWMVQTLTPGQSGVITISGVLTVPLTAGVYSNTATIAIAGNLLATGNTAVVTFTVPNVTPAFTSMPITATSQNALYTYTVIAGDNNSDVLTLTTPTLPTWLTFSDHGDGTATLIGMPANSDVGAHAVALHVTDNGGLFATQIFTLTVTNVNDAPEFTSTPITTATQDTLYTYVATAADLDVGDTLVITATTKPAWLILTEHGDGTATLTGTPTNSDVGDHPVVLRVTDSGGLFATQVFTITVANVNDAPEFTSAPITAATQDALYTYSVTAADLDVGDTLVITATAKPAWLMLTDHGDGTATLTGTPTDADVGAHPVVLRVTDSAGLFVEQVFTITVTEKPKYYLYLPLALKNAP